MTERWTPATTLSAILAARLARPSSACWLVKMTHHPANVPVRCHFCTCNEFVLHPAGFWLVATTDGSAGLRRLLTSTSVGLTNVASSSSPPCQRTKHMLNRLAQRRRHRRKIKTWHRPALLQPIRAPSDRNPPPCGVLSPTSQARTTPKSQEVEYCPVLLQLAPSRRSLVRSSTANDQRRTTL